MSHHVGDMLDNELSADAFREALVQEFGDAADAYVNLSVEGGNVSLSVKDHQDVEQAALLEKAQDFAKEYGFGLE